MNIISFDNIIIDPDNYIKDILSNNFCDVHDGEHVFNGIQQRGDDEFSAYVLSLFHGYEVTFNFIRKSCIGQEEPNYIHSDEMMGDITAILYLSKEHPSDDGTTMYDDERKPLARIFSKFNRMVAFDSSILHSRNIFENFGEEDKSRLIQVIFLKHILIK
jgi:hypothetical protein